MAYPLGRMGGFIQTSVNSSLNRPPRGRTHKLQEIKEGVLRVEKKHTSTSTSMNRMACVRKKKSRQVRKGQPFSTKNEERSCKQTVKVKPLLPMSHRTRVPRQLRGPMDSTRFSQRACAMRQTCCTANRFPQRAGSTRDRRSAIDVRQVPSGARILHRADEVQIMFVPGFSQ